ncbi:unnamed protein product [Haemonchus placei]|uniref:LINE-1 type transposase domain-containing protein 1 n=1 Tax=Haemonchus placei TaxID=6290 RepID=A0A0N4X6Y8_HAEPC|nr:unnamed protein product [Haemonchus placei]
MLEQFASSADRIEKALTSSLAKLTDGIEEVTRRQSEIISRLDALEERVTSLQNSSPLDQNLLYSTLVKVKADSDKIEGKLRRITWVGIGEQADEHSTKKFDQEALREVILSSGDDELIEEFSKGRITAHRHPPVKPRNQGGRDRIIKIELPSSAMKDRLLRHMKSGRQSLTRRFVHSYARRDYTVEELELDRSLRKQAGLANAKVGKLQYVVRDLQIHQLKNARQLSHRGSTSFSESAKASSGSWVGSMDASIVGTSRSPNISP